MTAPPDADVLIIGSGAAGLAAAIAARDSGARRLLVAESESVVGGSSRLSGGVVMASGTRYQRKSEVEDEAAKLFHECKISLISNSGAGVKRVCT